MPTAPETFPTPRALRALASAAACCGLLGLAATASAQVRTPIDEFNENVERGGRFEPGTVTVKVDPHLGPVDVARLAARVGCTYDHQFGRRPYHVVACDETKPMAGLIVAFSSMENVRWVEAGFYDEEEAVPNDLFELQWYHRNTGQAVDMQNGLPGADMSSIEAWEVTTGSPARVIAIVDIGVYTDHLDLAPQRWSNSGENCTNGIDDDNNGYVDDCRGWDIGENDNDASPLSLPTMQSDGDPCLRWHATYIAGLAAAQGNNNLGLAGTAWDVSLMNLKRHRDSSCQGTSTRSAEATFYAVDNGADVLGYSFNSTTNSTSFREAIAAADAAGVVAVMSAGNGGSNINNTTRYPNNYPMNLKIITGASDNRDQLDPASNYGSTKVDIASPGTYVVSTAIEDNQSYGVGSGTSMAVGFGLAAVTLGRTAFPAASPAQVQQAILQGGRAVPGLSCSSSSRCVRTGRRLDLLGMLQQLRPLSPASLSLSAVGTAEIGNSDGKVGPGERAVPTFTVQNGGPGGAFGLAATLNITSGPGLTVQDPGARFGSANAGASLSPVSGLPSIVVPAGCNTDFDAQVTLTVSDVLGHSAQANWTLPIRCQGAPPPVDAGIHPDASTNPSDAGVARDGSSGSTDGSWVRDSGVHRDGGFVVRDSGVHHDSGGQIVEPNLPEPEGCSHTGRPRSGPAWLGLVLLGGATLVRRRRRS